MKKALKIIGIVLAIVIAFLAAAPFIFKSQIKDMVRKLVNDNVNAKVEFADVHLSLLTSFPQAHVTVESLKITNVAPFENDTLVNAKSIAFDMSVKELFKKQKDEPITINTIAINAITLNLIINKEGKANYDIAKKTSETVTNDAKPEKFSFDIENYSVANSNLKYHDIGSGIELNINKLNHTGKALVSENLTELDTHTDSFVSLSLDSTNYIDNHSVKLDALLDLDLNANKYTFKNNKALINNLPIEFDGFLQLIEEGQLVDISFNNPGATFKDFLAITPKKYTQDLNNIETTGDFKISGSAKGKMTKTTIPEFNVNMLSNNASFKYPDLPKRVEDININATVKNTTGNMDDTFVNLNKLNFKIDEDKFNSSAQLLNVTKNMIVDAKLDGTINLSNISKAYPIKLEKELSGIVKGTLDTHFDMNAIETNNYERIKNNGTLNASNLVFSSDDIVNPIRIATADINFKPGTVTLESFNAKTGKSDIEATGTISNLLAYLVTGKKLKGDFKVNSNLFLVSDFMVEGGTDQPINQSVEPDNTLKIPSFLDCSITTNAKTVIYDNLTLKEVKGEMVLADEKAVFNNVSSLIFDGSLNMNGFVDTKNKTPKFNMNLDAKQFSISESFQQLELLQALAPIAKSLQGKLNTSIALNGDLGDDFTPILTSVTGDALAELIETKINQDKQKILGDIQSSLNFIQFDKFNLKDLKTKISFKNGKANVQPFNLNYNDINMTISGSHSFSNIMDYKLKLDVPAKYLGDEVASLITKIGDNSLKSTKVPVTITINGLYSDPKIKTDLKTGVSDLTNKLIQIQKQKLITKGKNKAGDIVKDVIKNKSKDPVKDVIDIIGGKKNKTNATDNKDNKTIDKAVKDVIGIFGKKKN